MMYEMDVKNKYIELIEDLDRETLKGCALAFIRWGNYVFDEGELLQILKNNIDDISTLMDDGLEANSDLIMKMEVYLEPFFLLANDGMYRWLRDAAIKLRFKLKEILIQDFEALQKKSKEDAKGILNGSGHVFAVIYGRYKKYLDFSGQGNMDILLSDILSKLPELGRGNFENSTEIQKKLKTVFNAIDHSITGYLFREACLALNNQINLSRKAEMARLRQVKTGINAPTPGRKRKLRF